MEETMYKLPEDDLKLLNKLLLMKDLNPEDGYSKEKVIEYINANRELEEAELNQIRNYVLDKNLEYGFYKNGEPNELGYATEELGDKLFYIMEDELNMYTLYDTLNDIEKELAGNDFIRIHQSYLVNMKHIVKMSRNKNGRHDAVLSNGIKLGIPKARYKKVDETFIAYKGVW